MIDLEVSQVSVEPSAVAVPVVQDDVAFSAWYRSEHPRLLAAWGRIYALAGAGCVVVGGEQSVPGQSEGVTPTSAPATPANP